MSNIQRNSNEIKDSYTRAFETDGAKVPADNPRLPDNTENYIASFERKIEELESKLHDKDRTVCV